MPEGDDLRAELADIAASLRAYLEQQAASGATGIPRGTGPLAPGVVEVPEAKRAVSTPIASPSPVVPKPARVDPGIPEVDRHLRLPQLAAEIAVCTKCALASSRTQTVFARGNPDAALCFIGEAPGADEDAQGLPFVGRAGQLLDKMIQAMGLSPEKDVYVINIIRCRPPGNRRPEPAEVAACLPYLHEQLDLVKPKVIVALGNTSVGTLLGTTVGISKLRGQWKLYRGSTLVMPTYHPSYLLRPSAQQQEAKRQAWEDLQEVMKELGLPLPGAKKAAGGKPSTGGEPS